MATLVKKILITGDLILKTGLHIGGTNSSLNIGGPDKFVVRNPLTNRPYIPGSSLKGKMRALIELLDGNISTDNRGVNGPTRNPHTRAGNLFGTVGDNQQPSRLIVRDADLLNDFDDFKNTDLPYTETKTEVSIDRITSSANPRTFERVPAGARFKLEMVLNVFDTDNEMILRDTIKQAIKLLEDDYLGGHGSRGYGQIQISDLNFEDRGRSFYETA